MKLNFNGTPRRITPKDMELVRHERRDGWKSALSGVGMASFDKRETVVFEADLVTIPEAREMWRGDDLAARIIETVPRESVREGFKFSAGDDDQGLEIAEKVMEKWKKHDAYGNLRMARCFERAYGGGAILIGANDGQKDLAKPLNTKTIRSMDFLTYLEPDELHPLRWYSNPMKPNYGKPALYQLNPYVVGNSYDREGLPSGLIEIHESRLIVFHGMQVSRNVAISMNGGWGDSTLTRSKRILRDFNMSWSSAAILMMEFATPIFKMKGLDQLIAMDRDDEFKRRIQAAQLARSVLRAMLIDAEEEFTREQTPVSGIPELLDRFATRLAAAADMPVTLLMGQSPAGLNATGESDIRFFYDRTKGSQTIHEIPALNKVSKIIMAADRIDAPDTWSIEPNPLWQPSEAEQATTRFTQAQTDQIYLTTSVVTPKQVQENRFSSDGGSMATMVDEQDKEAEEDDSQPLPPDIRQVPGQAPDATGAAAPPTASQFNGAQIQSAYSIVAGIGKKEIPRASAIQMLQSFFGLKPDEAAKMAVDFTAAPDPSAPKPTAPPVGKSPFQTKPKMDGSPDQPCDELEADEDPTDDADEEPEKPEHEQHAERGRDAEAKSKGLAAEGKLREAAVAARQASASFKAATKSATEREGRNEAKARRARERRVRAKGQ